MIIQISDVLNAGQANDYLSTLADENAWVTGASSAKGRALAVKHNLQARTDLPKVQHALGGIQKSFAENNLFMVAARPAETARVLFNRYDEGMSYGAHADAAYMGDVRTDVSFTIFLSPPESYDGGELMIEHPGGFDSVKLNAGAMVMYPSSSVHQVTEVTRGSRICAVGWVRSRIRSPEKRAMLFELERALFEIKALENAGTPQDRLGNLRNNLLRLWGE